MLAPISDLANETFSDDQIQVSDLSQQPQDLLGLIINNFSSQPKTHLIEIYPQTPGYTPPGEDTGYVNYDEFDQDHDSLFNSNLNASRVEEDSMDQLFR